MEYYMLWPLMQTTYMKPVWLHVRSSERLEALQAEGRLLTAGPNPLPDNPERVSGSLIVAKFASARRSPRMGGTRSLSLRATKF